MTGISTAGIGERAAIFDIPHNMQSVIVESGDLVTVNHKAERGVLLIFDESDARCRAILRKCSGSGGAENSE